MYRSIVATVLAAAAVVTAQTPVSQEVYNNILRYTSYAAAAYSDDCRTPPFGSRLLKFINGTSTDTQVTLFRDPNVGLVLAFRGTSTPIDLDTDFLFTATQVNIRGINCAECKVHQGFQDGYNSVANDIASALSAAGGASGSRIIVTGHSLGAGLASFGAAALAGQGYQVTAYTYGEPRNGDAAFSTYVNRLVPNYFRVTHANDGVPKIPPRSLGFTHHGTEYWESTQPVTLAGTVRCDGTEPTQCSQAQDFGDNPINGNHIQYSNLLVASSLYNAGCGFKFP